MDCTLDFECPVRATCKKGQCKCQDLSHPYVVTERGFDNLKYEMYFFNATHCVFSDGKSSSKVLNIVQSKANERKIQKNMCLYFSWTKAWYSKKNDIWEFAGYPEIQQKNMILKREDI